MNSSEGYRHLANRLKIIFPGAAYSLICNIPKEEHTPSVCTNKIESEVCTRARSSDVLATRAPGTPSAATPGEVLASHRFFP